MNLKTFFILALVVIAIGCTTEQTPDTDNDQAPVKIGVIVPLSGDVAAIGTAVKNGVELAKKDMNLNVELIYEDTGCNGQKAVTATQKLIAVDGVKAIIGEVCSSATLPTAPVVEENRIVMISPGSTSPKITEAGEYVFRVIPSDALQGEFGARMVYDAGYRKLAIIYTNEDYGLGFSSVLEESFKALGGEIVAKESVTSGSVDVRTQVTKVKEAKPEAVFVMTNSFDSSAAILKQLKTAGVDAQYFGGESLKDPQVIEGSQGGAEGMIISAVSGGNAAFIQSYKEEYGAEPPAFAAQGYDAMQAIGLALQSDAELKDAVAAAKFEGATGSIAFDENGDVAGNYDVFVVKDGVFVPQE